MKRRGSALMGDVENAADAAQPGDAQEDTGNALMTALAAVKKKKRPTQLGTPPVANGQQINGASLSTNRVGY